LTSHFKVLQLQAITHVLLAASTISQRYPTFVCCKTMDSITSLFVVVVVAAFVVSVIIV
jgi:hypothetical protein